ncbi:hypothetical protein MVEG_12316 [Podila verticillata NRRL 6337]|uniref:ZZ-type domain-containing protein n=1 Tax=Podila verticillata NRRL 6337 TaxID=1069443 RepID=A0A086TIN0_9FUNG|nr:hypothetical protein MVEG_12316 [Podila verticillata NRRL 6337]
MSQKYRLSPRPEAPTPPLLDLQNNPTPLLNSFADGVFNYLDHACEPKGSRLLEQNKIAAMHSFILPHEHHVKMQEFRPVLYNSYYMAFAVETSFGDNGPAVTRLGFHTYLRAMIMSDPDEAFKNFSTLNQAMQLGHQFDRSQFLRVADPKAKNIDKRLKEYISKVLTDIGLKVYQDGFCDICFNTIGHSYQSCLDCSDYAVCEECFTLAPKRHISGHRFESIGSTEASEDMVHEDITCDICCNGIVGVRHKCQNCDDYDLCQGCLVLAPERHTSGHIFKAIKRSESHQERVNELINMMTSMADTQFARNAAQSEHLGRIGTGVCYSCGYKRCRCGGNYDVHDLMGSI